MFTMKIEPPTEIIQEGEAPEDDQEKPKKRGMTKIEYDFAELREDFDDLRTKVSEFLQEMRSELKSVKNSMNAQGGRLGGFTVKELMALKQLGIRPQDLLSMNTSDLHGKAQEEGQKNNSRV